MPSSSLKTMLMAYNTLEYMCATLVQAVCGLFRLLSQALTHSLHYNLQDRTSAICCWPRELFFRDLGSEVIAADSIVDPVFKLVDNSVSIG